MKIIHTSDWHLGQYFYTKSRMAEHQLFLDWLIEQVEQYQVDAIIVAGDIFDTGSPPSYAREIYNRFVVTLQRTNCQLIILAGNHDSVATLNESKDLLACLNTQVIAKPLNDNEIITLTSHSGQPGAIVCAVPFLRPRDIQISHAGQSELEKQQTLLKAITDHYQSLYQKAIDKREEIGLQLPIIMTGHLTTVGAKTTDSVRDIYIGTLEAFPSSAFPPADYIALGHIHRPQIIGGDTTIRYSGSPIALSFDEVGQQKSVCLLHFKKDNNLEITELPIPQFQPMACLRGDLATIEQALVQIKNTENTLPVWLDIEVATQDYLNDIQKRIQKMTEDLPVEIILLRRERSKRNIYTEQDTKETLDELSVEDVFSRRLDQSDLELERKTRVTQLFKMTLQHLEQPSNEEK